MKNFQLAGCIPLDRRRDSDLDLELLFSKAEPDASVRIYYEALHAESVAGITYDQLRSYIPEAKLGLLHLLREISIVLRHGPRHWVRVCDKATIHTEVTLLHGKFRRQ